MRLTLALAGTVLVISSSAMAQPFELEAGLQYVHVHERILDPEFCEGIEFSDSHNVADLEPARFGLSHRFRCGRQRTLASANFDTDTSSGGLTASMNGTCELETEIPVTGGRSEASLIGWYEALLSTTAWRRFHLVGRIDVQAEILHGDEEWDGGYATISVERGRLGGLDEFIFWQAVSVDQPESRVIDAIVDVPPGEFTIFMGMEQFSLQQDSARQNGPERIAAHLDFELTVVPCSADINWDNRVDMHDLGVLLSNLYQVESRESGDLSGDGFVDLSDLSILLAAFGEECLN